MNTFRDAVLIPTPDTSSFRTDPEWLALAEELRRRKPDLVADFLHRFPATEVYAGLVSHEEIVRLVEDTMEMYLVFLHGDDIAPELARIPTQLGRDRARQCVPVQELLTGVRTNSRVIWHALRSITDEAASSTLVRHTDIVLDLVEWHVRSTQAAYLLEEEQLARQGERRRQRAVRQLFDSTPNDARRLAAIAADLRVTNEQLFDVIAEAEQHDDGCGLCRLAPAGLFVHESESGVSHVVATGDRRLRGALSGRRATIVENVRGLAAVPSASAAGLAIVRERLTAPLGAVSLAEAWPEVAWSGLTESIPVELLPLDHEAMRQLARPARARLLETVRLYLDSGSIQETAEAQFCHRNTIVKRLARFEEITGLRLSKPRDAALALLALASLER